MIQGGEVARASGAKAPALVASVTEWEPSPVIDTSEFDDFDRAGASAKEQEAEYGPGFYHKKLREDMEGITQHPTIVMVSGPYRFDESRTPIWGAKLACSGCGFEVIYRGWAHMEANIPEECGREEGPDQNCFLHRGKLKAQHDRRRA